jgi:uncharacterized RDD family membrane protein YckC
MLPSRGKMDAITINTNQNISIDFELAGAFQRLVATLIDFAILTIYFIIMTTFVVRVVVADWFSGSGSMTFWEYFFVFLIYLPFFLYTPVMELFTKGKTIGKMVMGIRVMKSNGDNGTGGTYFTRWLFRPFEIYVLMLGPYAVLAIFVSGFLDLVLVSTSAKNQRLGDFLAGSVIVKNKSDERFTIKDILAIKSNENYTVTYPNVAQFSEDEMLMIKRIINRAEVFKNKAAKNLAVELVHVLTEKLELDEVPKKKLVFLKTVLRDYIVLTR